MAREKNPYNYSDDVPLQDRLAKLEHKVLGLANSLASYVQDINRFSSAATAPMAGPLEDSYARNKIQELEAKINNPNELLKVSIDNFKLE